MFKKIDHKKNKSFCLSVEIEPDFDAQWNFINPFKYKGVFEGMPRIHDLCERYNIIPTYFINSVVLDDEKCIRFLKSLKRCELGTHLHPELIDPPPYHHSKQFDYHSIVEFQKLNNLTHQFKSIFYQPKSFRSGRMCARGWTIHCLKLLGYTHDSSVAPFKRHYARARILQPYRPSEKNILKKDDKGIVIEVPISITPGGRWLTYRSIEYSLEVIKWYEKNYSNPTLCFKFHNIEFASGSSPFTKTSEECERYLKGLELLVTTLTEKGYSSICMYEIT